MAMASFLALAFWTRTPLGDSFEQSIFGSSLSTALLMGVFLVLGPLFFPCVRLKFLNQTMNFSLPSSVLHLPDSQSSTGCGLGEVRH